MRKIVYALAFLLGLLVNPLHAQNTAGVTKPTFYIFVDTAHVAAVAPNTFVTWIFAASVPHPTPMVSSALLVAFDCKAHKVARQYHIVYRMKADSTGVEGPIEEDPGTWVEPQTRYAKMFDMVCSVGATRPYDPTVGQLQAPDTTKAEPGPDPKSLYPVS